jgi:PIN like domain
MSIFFFDNDISFRIAHALRELVAADEILALRDRFPVDTPDSIWIPEAGRQKWVVISRDHNQRRRDTEHEALRANQVSVLYIRYSAKQELLFADAARLIKNWPKISKWGSSVSGSNLARLTTAGQDRNTLKLEVNFYYDLVSNPKDPCSHLLRFLLSSFFQVQDSMSLPGI